MLERQLDAVTCRVQAGDAAPLEQELARAESNIARLGARRAEAERVPNPSVGLHYPSERSSGVGHSGRSAR